jgi:hypothetical protein
VQSSRRISEDYICTELLGLLDGVEDHASRIRAVLTLDDFAADPATPRNQLVNSRRTEGISSRENAALALGVEFRR